MTPWKKFVSFLAEFGKVKSIVTLAIVFTFCFLAIRGDYISSEFIIIATAVVTYHFCKDSTIGEKIREHEKDLHENNKERI